MSRLLVNFPVGTQPSSHLPLAHLHSHLHRRSHPPAMIFVCRRAGRQDEWEMRSTKVRKIQQIFEHLKESTMESMALCLHWPLGKKVPRSSISCEEFHRDRAVISHAPHESWTVCQAACNDIRGQSAYYCRANGLLSAFPTTLKINRLFLLYRT